MSSSTCSHALEDWTISSSFQHSIMIFDRWYSIMIFDNDILALRKSITGAAVFLTIALLHSLFLFNQFIHVQVTQIQLNPLGRRLSRQIVEVWLQFLINEEALVVQQESSRYIKLCWLVFPYFLSLLFGFMKAPWLVPMIVGLLGEFVK